MWTNAMKRRVFPCLLDTVLANTGVSVLWFRVSFLCMRVSSVVCQYSDRRVFGLQVRVLWHNAS